MTFARAKPAGWTDNVDTITATQLNTIDTNVSNALDGAGGGAYSPATVLEVDGAGIRTDELLLDGSVDLESGADIDVQSGATIGFASGSTLQVDSTATMTVDTVPTFTANVDMELELRVLTIEMGITNTVLASVIRKSPHIGTGTNIGSSIVLTGQDGQAQTGATINNDGGHIDVAPGAAGLGGSTQVGGVGGIHHTPKNAGANPGTGYYEFAFNEGVGASAAASWRLPVVFGSDITAVVDVQFVARSSGGSNTYTAKRQIVVNTDGSGGIVAVAQAAVRDPQTVGFGGGVPTLTAGASTKVGQVVLSLQENSAVAINASAKVTAVLTAPVP